MIELDYLAHDFPNPGFYRVWYRRVEPPLGPFPSTADLATQCRLVNYPIDGYILYWDGEELSSVPSLNPDELVEVWYCWRVRVDERLLIPRSNPHLYEQPADSLFATAEEARAWRAEELDNWDEQDEQAYIRTWILCKETLEVVQT